MQGVVSLAAEEVEEEQACLDLADLILETAKLVDRLANANTAPGGCCFTLSQLQHNTASA